MNVFQMMDEPIENQCPTGILIDLSERDQDRVPFPKAFFGGTDAVNISPVQHEYAREVVEDVSPLLKIRQHDENIQNFHTTHRSTIKFNVSTDSDADLLENVTLDLNRSSDASSESKDELFFVDSEQEIENSVRSKHQYDLSIQEIVEVFKEATTVAIQLRNYGRGVDSGSPNLKMPFKRYTNIDSSCDSEKEGPPKPLANSTFSIYDLKLEGNEDGSQPPKFSCPAMTDEVSTIPPIQALHDNREKAVTPTSSKTCHPAMEDDFELKIKNDVKPEEVHIADTQDLESEIVDKSLQTPKSVPMIEKTDELPQCTKVTDVLRDSNKTFMLKPSKIRNSSLNISADSEKENAPKSENESIVTSKDMKREVEKGISQPPKLALHPGVINDISTAELTQVLHANRRKAVTLKSSKNLNVPMKAIVTNPLNGLKNSAIMKNRSHSDGSESQYRVKTITKLANPTKTGSLSDLVPTNFTGGASRVSKVIQKQVKVIPPSSSSSSGHKSDQSVDPGSFTAGQKRRSYAYTPTSKVSYPDSTNRGMSPGGPSVHGTVTKSVSATTERQESSPRRSSVSGTVTKSVSTAAERHGMSPRRSSVFGTVTKPAVNVVERQRDGTTPKVCLVRRKSFGTGQISPSPTKSSPNSVKIAPSTSVAPGRRRSGIPGLTFITPPKISKNGTASTNVPVRRSSSFGGQIKKVSATPTPAGSRKQLFQHRANV